MGHDLDMKSRVHPKYKTNYRVDNWAEYDRALVQRGDITLWIPTDATDAWKPAHLLDEAAGGSGAVTFVGVERFAMSVRTYRRTSGSAEAVHYSRVQEFDLHSHAEDLGGSGECLQRH